MEKLIRVLWVTLVVIAFNAEAISEVSQSVQSYESLAEELGLAELAATFDAEKIERVTGSSHDDASYALFVGLGVLSAESSAEVLLPEAAEELKAAVRALPAFVRTAAIGSPVAREDADYIVLEHLLFEALAANLTTGYNVTRTADWPDYDDSRMIIYGHNDLKHMRQLLCLLKTEGLEPEFAFLPKRSAFKIREGWGVADGSTPRLSDGTPVAIITEQELFLEFASVEEIAQFQDLVTRYAKKDSEDEPGLLYRSWWQPFYRSLVPREGMRETREIWVSVGGLKANILALPEEAPEKQAAVESLSTKWSVEASPLWVNPSFYRYLLGDFK